MKFVVIGIYYVVFIAMFISIVVGGYKILKSKPKINILSGFYYLTYIFLFLFASASAYEKFNILTFYDFASFTTMIGGLIFTLVNFRFKEIAKTIFISFSRKEFEFEDLVLKNKVINSLWKNSITFAWIISLIAFVIIFTQINDSRKLGPSIAVISISALYAVLLKSFLIIPVETSIKRKMILLGSSNANN